MNESLTPCIACTASGLKYFGHRGAYAYYRCLRCGSLQLSPLPEPASMAEEYVNGYSDAGHCQSAPEVRNIEAKPQFDAVCDALLRHAAPRLVLDYGTGWGGLLKTLKDRSINAEGAELSASMAEYCQKMGFTVRLCDLADIPGEAVYDAIALSSVFEHLVEHERWVHDASRLLTPRGLVVSMQPTAGFATFWGQALRLGFKNRELPQLHQVFWPPWHTALFSIEGMRLLFQRCGFELLEVVPAPFQQQSGLTGLLQRTLSGVNAAAAPLFGVNWPLHVGHVFVFRKHADCVA